jgi:hypothetical protein
MVRVKAKKGGFTRKLLTFIRWALCFIAIGASLFNRIAPSIGMSRVDFNNTIPGLEATLGTARLLEEQLEQLEPVMQPFLSIKEPIQKVGTVVGSVALGLLSVNLSGQVFGRGIYYVSNIAVTLLGFLCWEWIERAFSVHAHQDLHFVMSTMFWWASLRELYRFLRACVCYEDEMVDIHVWDLEPESLATNEPVVGHAALALHDEDETYISWWPGAEERNPKKLPRPATHDTLTQTIGRKTQQRAIQGNLISVPKLSEMNQNRNRVCSSVYSTKGQARSMFEDVVGENFKQPTSITIYGLNTEAMADWWEEWKSCDRKWATIPSGSMAGNCSSTAKDALVAGGALSFYELHRQQYLLSLFPWTPMDVLALAQTHNYLSTHLSRVGIIGVEMFFLAQLLAAFMPADGIGMVVHTDGIVREAVATYLPPIVIYWKGVFAALLLSLITDLYGGGVPEWLHAQTKEQVGSPGTSELNKNDWHNMVKEIAEWHDEQPDTYDNIYLRAHGHQTAVRAIADLHEKYAKEEDPSKRGIIKKICAILCCPCTALGLLGLKEKQVKKKAKNYAKDYVENAALEATGLPRTGRAVKKVVRHPALRVANSDDY